MLVDSGAAPAAAQVGHRVQTLVVLGSTQNERRPVKVHLWYPAEPGAYAAAAKTTYTSALYGVEEDYAASTTATVISTAGDATLSVSDPGHLANGAFSLPSPLHVAFSTSSWTAPVSNASVTISFQQHVGRTDALRTGSDSRTLTFTLSTTAP